MKYTHTFDSFQNRNSELNEAAAVLTREGEDLAVWLKSVINESDIKKAKGDGRLYVLQLWGNQDLTTSLFNLVRKWNESPSHLDVYMDDISVRDGVLNIEIRSNHNTVRFT